MRHVAAVRCGFDVVLTVLTLASAVRLYDARDWQGGFSFSFIAAILMADFLLHVAEAIKEGQK